MRFRDEGLGCERVEVNTRRARGQGPHTLVSLSFRLEDLLGPATRVKKKKKSDLWATLQMRVAKPGTALRDKAFPFEVGQLWVSPQHRCHRLALVVSL